MKIGDDVIVTKDPVAPILNGMKGTIIETETFNGEQIYRIRATNDGPMMANKQGIERKVRAWKVGDWRRLPANAMILTSG